MSRNPIRQAFMQSLLVLALIALLIVAVWLLVRPDETNTAHIEEIVATVPDTTQQADQAVNPENPPALRFTDITRQAGIAFQHVNAAYGERLMPESMGSGLGFFDYDNDGDPDLFVVNAERWPDHDYGDAPPVPTQHLYRNDGRGQFTDVTEQAGLAIQTFGMGVAFGDFDGDGWTDLFLSTLHENRLFRNDRGHFVDVTAQAGVAGRTQDWSTSAAFLDMDNDGDLDLFVTNYVFWTRRFDLEIDFRLTGIGRAYGAPTHFPGTDSYLYRNDGNGHFTDVSSSAGIQVHNPDGSPVGKGLGVRPFDYDGDGRIDLLVANDTVRNFLFHNLGNGRFEEIGEFEGLAYDRDGRATGAMGIDVGYFRNDADLAVVIGNFANEMSSLFVTAEGHTPFADEAVINGIGPASRLALTFGVAFLDLDLDGRLDLVQANGHLEPEINTIQPSQTYAQPGQAFWNCGEACRDLYRPITDPGDLGQRRVGRGLAYADIDADGDLDLAISVNGGAIALLRNDLDTLPGERHWLRIKLQGAGANPEAIGARVRIRTANGDQLREVMPTRGYLSQVELPITFGLGEETEIEELTVTWPDGSSETRTVERVDTTLTISEDDTL
ncbi:MAG: CRTAC1 family protein [Gammaproteobacteria bacterium]|nr:CRTAC1 family protein [Gammaproteobacteria bacterium]MCP5135509.1 CRTAC1 family protein [Gammaproteobacteria bacterium]